MKTASIRHRAWWAAKQTPLIGKHLPMVKRSLFRAAAAPFRMLPREWQIGPPRGVFSAYELVKGGQAPGHIILEQQRAPAVSPKSLRRIAPLGQDQHYRWPFFWSYHANATLIGPTLLLTNSRNEAAFEAAYGDMYIYDPGYNRVRRGSA